MGRLQLGILAGMLALVVAVYPRVGAAQPATGSTCAVGASEQAVPDSWTRSHLVLQQSVAWVWPVGWVSAPYWVWVTETWTRVTYYNYRNVTGLFYARTQHPNGTVTDTIATPTWLQAAYRYDFDALIRDVRAGLVHDRGPCA